MTEAEVFQPNINPVTSSVDISMLPEESGVYAIFDAEGALLYVGLSRQIRKSVEGHVQALGPQEAANLVYSVKCLQMAAGSKEALTATWEKWVQDHLKGGGDIPSGNLPETAPGADPRWRSRAGATAKPSLSLTTGGSVEDALEAVKQVVQDHPVVLFMKGVPAAPQCGFSAKVVGILRELGVQYESVNVLDAEANAGVREAVKEFSQWPTVPQVFFQGELLGGADIVTELHEAGLLRDKLLGADGPAQTGEQQSSKADPAESASIAKGEVVLIEDAKRPTATLVSKLLREKFDLHGLQIVDESASHAGDPGVTEMGLSGESHFRLDIVAPEFEGLSPVQRQQKVFAALGDVMPKIHALSLVTSTPTERSKQ